MYQEEFETQLKFQASVFEKKVKTERVHCKEFVKLDERLKDN